MFGAIAIGIAYIIVKKIDDAGKHKTIKRRYNKN